MQHSEPFCDPIRAARRTEAWFRALMEQSPLSTQVFAPDGRTIEVNRAWEKLWGATIESVANYNILDDPQLVERGIMPYIRRGFAGEALPIPAVWYDPDETVPGTSSRRDSRRWVRAFIHPIKDENDRVTEVVLIHEDMTDQKLSELAAEANAEQLRSSEERFQRFMQHLPGLAWIKDANGRYVFANESALKTFQVAPETLYGFTDEEVFPAETAEQFRRNDQKALASNSGVQAIESLRHGDGIVHHSLVSKFVIPGPHGPAFVGGMAIDITDLNQTQLALRQSEERLRLALAAGHMGVWEWNLHTNQLWWSDDLEPLHGLEPGSFGGTIEDFNALVHPDDQDLVQSAIGDAIARCSDFNLEFRTVWPNGEVHWMAGIGKVLPDEHGTPARMLGVGMDVTKRHEAEAALHEADRRKNEFLATLAHELRNPLAPICNSLELMQLAIDDRATQEQARSIMERQLQQMVRLVDDLLDISRTTRNRLELRKTKISLASAIHSAVEASRPWIASFAHELTINLPSEDVFLMADHTRLAQMISNLLNNAAKYTNRGGRIVLSVARERSQASISVRDNGIGIAAEHLSHLFEMFSQVASALDRSQGGLGIGLALVRGLAEMHGGTIEARSDGLGAGSEFILRLPVLDESVVPAVSGNGSLLAAPGRCRILVVDDNKDGADSLSMTLRITGHDTYTAYDGVEGVQAAEWFHPEVILLDIGLPKLNGYEVAKRIRAEPWGQTMLLVAVTGWGQHEDKQRAKVAGFDYHLTKPLDHGELKRILSSAKRLS